MSTKIRLTKLTDTQLILLSEASREGQGRVRLPDHIRGGAIHRVLARLIADHLIEPDDRPGDEPRRSAEGDEGVVETYRITPAGLSTIGVVGPDEPGGSDAGPQTPAPVAIVAIAQAPRPADADAASADAIDPAEFNLPQSALRIVASAKPASNKIATVVAMLNADAGASLADLMTATGWQPHTIRAAISRLRQAGRTTLNLAWEQMIMFIDAPSLTFRPNASRNSTHPPRAALRDDGRTADLMGLRLA